MVRQHETHNDDTKKFLKPYISKNISKIDFWDIIHELNKEGLILSDVGGWKLP